MEVQDCGRTKGGTDLKLDMSEDRLLDASEDKVHGRMRLRVIQVFLGMIALAILLCLILVAELDFRRTPTTLERQSHDQNTVFREFDETGLIDNRERFKPLVKKSPTDSRAPTKKPSTPFPSTGQPKKTIKVVVQPSTKIASIPADRSIKNIPHILKEKVEEPEPKPKPKPTFTVAQRLLQYGEMARKRLRPHFKAAGIPYPAEAITLVGLKKERRLELYAGKSHKDLKFIRHYPILAASGETGPKLKQGDKQVPEGLYRITALNPNSKFHLSLRVNYPNQFDVTMGKKDRRTKLGDHIMIHGDCVSAGCLAMGDEVAEELFVLASDTGLRRMRLILSPIDFRTKDLPKDIDTKKRPKWTKKLYARITKELKKLPLPSETRTSKLEEFLGAVFSRSTKK